MLLAGQHCILLSSKLDTITPPMPAPATPSLIPGRAYRTADFRRYGKNPARLAQRLVATGTLQQVARGLYVRPLPSKWGPVPTTEHELMRAFLDGSPFVITGPPIWNALGLGSTALFATTLVYNHKRTGEIVLDGRRFLLRRVAFPRHPTAEYFVVDLLLHHDMAGVDLATLEVGLTSALHAGRFQPLVLRATAAQYGTRAIVDLVDRALRRAHTSH